MQQLTYAGPNKVEWREVSAPRIEKEGQALVRPIAVASCDLDYAIVRGKTPFTGQFGLGHECVAVVVESGTAVTFKPGDVVVVPFQISCGRCSFCSRGFTASCTEVPRTSMYGIGAAAGDWGGALSDLLLVPYANHMLLRLPANVNPVTAASASDNVSDAWRAVGPQLQARPGSEVLILAASPGGGSIPLYAVQIALAMGASRVDFFDIEEERVSIAESLGANARRLDGWPKRLGSYPITVDATGDVQGLACALRSTEPEGHCTSTIIYFYDKVEFPLLEMYMRGITYRTGRVNSRRELPQVLELIESGRINPDRVITQTARWEDAAEAILNYTTKLIISRE